MEKTFWKKFETTFYSKQKIGIQELLHPVSTCQRLSTIFFWRKSAKCDEIMYETCWNALKCWECAETLKIQGIFSIFNTYIIWAHFHHISYMTFSIFFSAILTKFSKFQRIVLKYSTRFSIFRINFLRFFNTWLP